MKLKSGAIALRAILCLPAAACLLSGQTQVDVRTQAKSVDFSAAGATKPAQTGSALPGTCSVGEVFFLTSASAGTNLRVCAAPNAWSQSGSATIAVKADGASIGATASVNMVSTSGSTVTVSQSGSDVNVAVAPDASIFATRANVQAGSDSYCASASGNTSAYSCSQPSPLKNYTDGMRLLWSPDVSCAGGVPLTLNVDGNGARRILQNDGNADPLASQCLAHSQILLTYSGSLNSNSGGWRMMSGPAGASMVLPHMIAYPFDGGGLVLSTGKVVYLPDIPFSCTITGWSLAVDQGTASADVWIGPDGASIPTSANSITGGNLMAIATGTRIRSTTMTGWTRLVSAHSSLAFRLASVSGATQVTVGVECDQ